MFNPEISKGSKSYRGRCTRCRPGRQEFVASVRCVGVESDTRHGTGSPISSGYLGPGLCASASLIQQQMRAVLFWVCGVVRVLVQTK